MLKKATKGFGEQNPIIGDADIVAPLPVYTPLTRCIDKGTHQAHVMIGNREYSVHDERRIALYLLNNILGGPGMNARLNLSLRDRNGLVYTVESTMVSYSDTGVWCTYFGCDPHDVKRCLRLVNKELQRVMESPSPHLNSMPPKGRLRDSWEWHATIARALPLILERVFCIMVGRRTSPTCSSASTYSQPTISSK